MWSSAVFLVVAAATAARAVHPLLRRQAPDPASFDWYALAPSDNISWTPCFDGPQCARLNLPLDHASPNGPKIQVALLMIPATDKENYKGTILINPGGPGGAGTQTVLGQGQELVALLGSSYDILGFDPRGTGATTPLARCFASPEQSDAWHLTDVQVLRDDDGSIPEARARDQVLGAVCERTLGGNGQEDAGGSADEWGPGRFMDTASVATDMLRIVEKLGQEKLQYYGISYGTVLGQYFAAMYPDKVGRMVLDGVVDGVLWQSGQDVSAVEDADRVMDAFFANCVQAGPSKCDIWETSADAVAQRLDRILAGVRTNPIPVAFGVSGPNVVTEDFLLGLIFSLLYTPIEGFPLIAAGARAVETRNTTFWSQVPFFLSDIGLPAWLQSNEAETVVTCSDSPPLTDSLTDDVAAVRNFTNLSRWAGPFVSRARITCGAWGIRAKARFTAPVSANLTVPVLVLSNIFDPVTPLSQAQAVVSRFQGTRLLVQNTVGHTVVLSPSICAATAVATYFLAGILPEEGTICQPDVVPLVDVSHAPTASVVELVHMATSRTQQ